jgi:hypothetical protein
MAAADVVSYDGWYAWRLVTDGRTLNQLRQVIAHAAPPGDNGSGTAHGPDLHLNFAN